MLIDTNTAEGKEQLEFHYLRVARQAASHKAWMDLMARFTDEQRQHVANLLAHDWHIGNITLRNTEDGRNYSETIFARTVQETPAVHHEYCDTLDPIIKGKPCNCQNRGDVK